MRGRKMRRHFTKILAYFLSACFMIQMLGIGGVFRASAEVLSNITLSYLNEGKWTNFDYAVNSPMDGIKIQTNPNASYYLEYRTLNEGHSVYYPFVKSTVNDYAGAPGESIQRLQIFAYDRNGVQLSEGIVVMYRVSVDNVWLPWVSNADPSSMQRVHAIYGLDGTLDTSGGFAGIPGKNITGVDIRVFDETRSTASGVQFEGGEVSTTLTYLTDTTWNSFNKSTIAAHIDGIKIQTPSGKPYYLQYRTLNEGHAAYYPFVKSTVNDYAGAPGEPIQRLQIQAIRNDGTNLTSGVIVMYRVFVDGRWLPWVSNADRASMQNIQRKYALDGTLDTTAGFAGIPGKNISGIEVRVFEDSDAGLDSSINYADSFVGVESTPSLSYLDSNTSSWVNFNQSALASMDGIKIQTGADKPYYLTYKTWNAGRTTYYPDVKSTENDYAGLPGSGVQLLSIHAYRNDGSRLTSGIVVMYRAYVEGRWLPWVSNADPQYMRSVQTQFNLGGTLDTGSAYAGIVGKDISGIEIRVFEGDISASAVGNMSDSEQTPALSYMSNSMSNWNTFDKSVLASTIDGIKIQTDTNKSYYLKYKTWNEGMSAYYPAVKSTENDYAGSPGRPIQLLNITAHANDGTNLVSNVIVMYRVHIENRWLPWVSNANPEWMQSVQVKYGLDGTLDTASAYAGISGKNINGVEIRVFEENSSEIKFTPTGNYKIIQAPHIYQRDKYPTGCESVSAVMALNHVGINISVDTFIDRFLPMSSGVPFDPNTTFGGNPRSSSGFGCYAPVIKTALDKALVGKGYRAQTVSGTSLENLCSQYIDKGIPVIMWATMEMKTPYGGYSWQYNGKTIDWIRPEHCLLLVGYDDNNYIFNDPRQKQAQMYYSKDAVETAYEGMHSQAIVLLKGNTSGVPIDNPSAPVNNPSATPIEEIKETHNNGVVADPVDLSTGSHIIENSLFDFAEGVDLNLTAKYNSSRLVKGSLGVGWYHNFEKSLQVKSENVIWVFDGPSVYSVYVRDESSDEFICQSPGKNHYVLTKQTDGSYILNCGYNQTETYDLAGRLVKIESRTKMVTTISYTDTTITITDMLTNQHIYLTLDDEKKVTKVSDDAGREVILGYTNDYLTTIQDVNGTTLIYTYNDEGRIESGYDSNNVGFFKNTYDDMARVICQYDGVAGSRPTLFSYGDNGVVTVTNRNGFQSTRVFDANHQLISYTDENGNTTTYSYDSRLNLISETDALGHSVTTVYNELNLPVQKTDRNGNVTTYAYDTRGNLTGMTFQNGASVEYSYNDRNLVVEQTDLRGTATSYFYNDDGQLIKKVIGNRTTTYAYENGMMVSSTDPEGNTTTYTYNVLGQVSSITDANNNTTSYIYDNKGHVLQTIDPLGNSITNTYDGNGLLSSSTDANGNTTWYSYTGNMKLASVTLPDGGNITYEYDGEDQVIKITDQNGNVKATVYDAGGRVIEEHDSVKSETIYEYDAANRIIKQINSNGSFLTRTYDACGNVLTQTDPAGNTTTYEYDVMSQLIKEISPVSGETIHTYNLAGDELTITNAMGGVINCQYDEYGNMVSREDPNGNVTTYNYDANNNLLITTDALGNVVTNQYDATGRLISTTNPNGHETTFTYDALGRKVSQTDPNGHTTSTQYDPNGNILTITDAKGVVQSTVVYNSNNLPVSTKDSLGNETINTYDPVGNLITKIDPLSNKQEYRYDEAGNLIESIDNQGSSSVSVYDNQGNILSITGPLEGGIQYAYDEAGRLIAQTTPSEGSIEYGYNALNLISELTNARGQETQYFYDQLGRLIGYTNAEGSASFTYDQNGNVLTATDQNGTITREFDALNRVTKYTDTKGKTIQYEYDAAGNLAKIIYPDSSMVIYTYDANNNLIKVTDWAGRTTTYTYDENDQLIEVVKPDGSVTTTVYDAAQRITSTVEKTASGVVIVGYEYSYDALGRIISEKFLAENKQYDMTYDTLSRVIERKETNLSTGEITTETYSYDAAGNITTFKVDDENNHYEYDVNNRLISYNGNPIAYDSDGNMISGFINGAEISMTYDSANRLITAGGITYQYDVYGNRIMSICGDNQKTYTYNTNGELSQLLVIESQGGTVTKFVYGVGLIGHENTEGFYTYHYDYRGSTTAITDEDGVITDTFSYDTYGQLLSHTGDTDTPFMYNGRDGVITDENGLLYMRARYYSPELKRFINADIIVGSIDNSQTLNRYAYVNGNPISYVDPFGLSADRTDKPWWEKAFDFVKGVGENIYEGAQNLSKPFVDAFKKATQDGKLDDFLSLTLGATPDEDGIYHIRQDWWQSWSFVGYNDLYDDAFRLGTQFTGTSMAKDKFEFSASDGTRYIIWVWKGDYVNLGAGAEAGIYKYGTSIGGMEHWLTATDENLKMELYLYDKKEHRHLYGYLPTEDTWWITGFDPSRQNVQAEDLQATVTIDFSDNLELYEGFKNTYNYDGSKWRFSGKSATLRW